jgi:hypothetical protein
VRRRQQMPAGCSQGGNRALLAVLPVRADTGLEISDPFCMAAETAVGAGDLPAARRLAERVRDLPFYREEGHLATARLLIVTALAGDWDETVAFAEQYREGWERAGRPRAGNLSRGAYAAATVHGLRGDERARRGRRRSGVEACIAAERELPGHV